MNHCSSGAVLVLVSLLIATARSASGVSKEVNSTVHVDNAGNENAGRSFENSDVDDGRHKGVRWDMVAIGVGVVVLLLVVLAISGVVTYAYSNSHKDRQRSRYIHQVLQMYEEESDSSSDYSIDDDPETNNLFERL